MSESDAMDLLEKQCQSLGQATVARELGVSAAVVSTARRGKYGASTENFLRKVVEVYGGLTVKCPIWGDIPMANCAEERGKPFEANQLRARVFQACQHCPNNPKGGKS